MFGKSKNDSLETNQPPKFKFNLGSVLEDKITGFKGVVMYRTQWLHNCNVYGLKPQTLKDGAPQDIQQFDEPQLSLVEKDVYECNNDTGGPAKPMPQSNRI
jgi:hypothetical protein